MQFFTSLVISATLLLVPLAAQGQLTSNWNAAVSGDWDDPSNWSTPNFPNNGSPPGTTYNAIVDVLGADYTVALATDITVDSLRVNSLNATVHHTGGVLEGAIAVDAGFFDLDGATIRNSTITSKPGPGRFTIINDNTTAVFDDVSIDGTVFANNGTLTILNDLTLLDALRGLRFNGGVARVELPGNQTVDGTGRIQFATGSNARGQIYATGGGTLTIGADVIVEAISQSAHELGSATSGLVINGTVRAIGGGAGSEVRIIGNDWVNNGSIIQDNSGTVNLGGYFRTANIGSLAGTGRVGIIGTLDNTSDVFTIDDTTGTITVRGSTASIVGGRIVATTPGHELRLNAGNFGQATLDGVTLEGRMQVSLGLAVVENGLTLDSGTVAYNLITSTISKTLRFPGNQTLGGTGEVVFERGSQNVIEPENGTLTIGPNVFIHNTALASSQSGTVGRAGDGLILQGSLSSEFAGKTIFMLGDQIENDGVILARFGGNIDATVDTMTNRSLLLVRETSSLDVVGKLIHPLAAPQALTAVSGTLTADSIELYDGRLLGDGLVDSDVLNLATISPGEATLAGHLTIRDLDQDLGGTLRLEIGGTTQGVDHDHLTTNNVSLDGIVAVNLVSSFQPQLGDMFDVLDWTTSFSGNPTFDFSGAMLAPGLSWDTRSFAATGQLLVIPEPGIGASMLACILLLIAGKGARWHSARESR